MAEFRGEEKVSPSEARLRVLEALGKSPRKKPKPSPKKTKKGKKKGKKKPAPPPPANKKPTPPPPQVHRPISTAPLAIQVPKWKILRNLSCKLFATPIYLPHQTHVVTDKQPTGRQ